MRREAIKLTNDEKFADLPWRANEATQKQYLDNLAPIAFFTYHRLDHTKKTFEALKRNVLAEHTLLYVFSDGPRNEKDIEKVAEVRQYLDTISGFKEIHFIKRENNMGLTKSIINGITDITEKHGKVIIIEDDILTTKYFLQYMNDALEIYKNEERVMAIAGFSAVENREEFPVTYFTKYFSCWGWATWKRSWQYFERDPEGKIEWDGCFDRSIAKHNGLVFYSKYDLSKNIGVDGTGEHPSTSAYYRGDLSDIKIDKFTLNVQECQLADKRVEEFRNGLNEYWRIEGKILSSLNGSTISFWRNNRGIRILGCLSRGSSYLILGDCRSEMLSHLLKNNGFKKVMPADIIDYNFQVAHKISLSHKMNIIDDFLVLNPDKFEIPSERYDYVFCRDIYCLSPNPYAMIQEMLRVAKRGVVLTNPHEAEDDNNITIQYEASGNFVFKLSVNELTKLAISLNLPAICRYEYNDAYIPNCEFEPADVDKSVAFKYITDEISKMDKAVLNGERKYNMVSIALFKKFPNENELENLKKIGVNFHKLPQKPV